MKKGQSGVSLIALVITIIVVIILAAIAFGTSTRTITNANWSTFKNAVGEVRTAFQTRTTTVKGQEAAKGITRNDAQVYNYVAKNGVADINNSGDPAWISRAQAAALTATRIEPTVIDGELGLSGRNHIKVNTSNRSGVEVSYYVSREGDIFIWPPYEYEGKYYVNETTTVANDAATSIVFSNVTVGVQADKADTTAAGVDVIPTFDGTGLASAKTVYWDDNHGSTLLPTGLETVTRYNDQSAN